MHDAEKLNRLTDLIIGGAINVHRKLGPGLLESTYEACLAYEINRNKVLVERQKALPVIYQNVRVDCGYRVDLLIEKSVVVEIKSLESILPVHRAQLLSYLRLSECMVGLLINFNVSILKNGGIVRIVNHFPESLRSQR